MSDDGNGLELYASKGTKAHHYEDKLTGLEFELRFRVRVSGLRVMFKVFRASVRVRNQG